MSAKTCLNCSSLLTGRQTMFCCRDCKSSHTYRNNKVNAHEGLEILLSMGWIDHNVTEIQSVVLGNGIILDSNIKGLPFDKININNKGYAIFSIKYGSVSLHRLVMELNGFKLIKPNVIDHKNRNKLDNRLLNLRFASYSQNSQNKPATRKKSSSKYKGVHKTASGKWQPMIWTNRKNIGFGSYETEEEAALVYNAKALELFGPDAYLNVV